MKLLLTEEQVYLQESFRGLFSADCPPELIRQFQADPQISVLDQLWTSLAKTGLFGLIIPEQYGGQGAALFDLGLALMEAGRALCPSLVSTTVAFAVALQRLGNTQHHQAWLPTLSAGEVSGTVALSNPGDASDVRPRVTATRTADGWRLDGSLQFVANADLADELLVSAHTDADLEPRRTLAFIVAREQLGRSHRRRHTMARDSQCTVTLNGVVITDPTRILGGDNDTVATDATLARISNALTALQTMEMVGGTQAVIDRTVDYLKMREQFGRPLASFQAAQHHIANMHIAFEGARLAAYQAAWWTSAGHLAEREVALAKLKCGNAYKEITLTAHQLHGGMGYMREFDLHLWSERAKSTELLGGPAWVQIRRLQRVLGLDDPR